MGVDRRRIIAINKRKDLTAEQKTKMIQALFTPTIPKTEEHVQSAEYEHLYDGMKQVTWATDEQKRKGAYDAVAVHVTIRPDFVPKDEFCGFSRELLSDYQYVGSLLYGTTRGKETKWRQLCNNKEKGCLKGCHFFNVEWAANWVQNKGVEFIECPMCRRGTHAKKQIAEQEIETMAQLMKEREDFKGAKDFNMMTFKDQQIVEKACSEYWDPVQNSARRKENEAALTEVLENWHEFRNFAEYQHFIDAQCKVAIKKNNSSILDLLLNHYNTKGVKPADCFNALVMEACDNNSVSSLDILISHGAEESKFCTALVACAKQKNIDLFLKVSEVMLKQTAINGLEEDYFFISGQLYKLILVWDNPDALRCIFRNRWKTNLEPEEEDLARNLDATNILQYFQDAGMGSFATQIDEDFLDMGTGMEDGPAPLTRETSWGPSDAGDDNWDDDGDDDW